LQTEIFDLVIRGGTLLTMSADMQIIEDGVVAIKANRIELVGKNIQPGADKVIRADGCLVIPGLVNTHAHLPMVCFRGMADDLALMDWLENHIFPMEARFVDKKLAYDGAMLAIAEMILSGTTTVCDGYFFENHIASAIQSCGMRAVVAQGFADFATPDNTGREKIISTAERFVRRWKQYAPLVTPAFFCHSAYTCSPQTLVAVKAAARDAGVQYMLHLMEHEEEARTIESRYGRKPVPHLLELGVLDSETVAVHCNWLSPEDIKVFASQGVRVSHNPASSMKLAAGVAPIPQMLSRGIPVGLGTDGAASNNTLDMFQEMNLAAKIHKAVSLDPTAMSAAEVVRMATIGGARVLGLDNLIGSIEEGKLADIIILDMNQPHLTPLYNPYSQLVYAVRGADVTTSIIDGKIVMENRRLLTMDPAVAMQNVRDIGNRIASEGKP
jgi:5-methylthioadenosine/S-adenosylhomocysteine deaminase